MIPLASKSDFGNIFEKFFGDRSISSLVHAIRDRTLSTQKKKFQKFWTLDSRNGAKVTSAISLDDLYKEDSRISPLFLRYKQIHEILQIQKFFNSTRPCLSALEFLKNSNFNLIIVSTALFCTHFQSLYCLISTFLLHYSV